jgi:hypothetical protein
MNDHPLSMPGMVVKRRVLLGKGTTCRSEFDLNENRNGGRRACAAKSRRALGPLLH